VLGAQATVPGEARGTCKLQHSIKLASPLHLIISRPRYARLSAECALVDIRQLKNPSLAGVIDRFAARLRSTIENIGARRLQTVMERVLDEVSFAAPDRAGDKVVIDAKYVEDHIGDLARNADLSRFIL